jgi:hypothetical protein
MRGPKPESREARGPGSGRTAKAILGVFLFLSAALASYGQADPPRRIGGGDRSEGFSRPATSATGSIGWGSA